MLQLLIYRRIPCCYGPESVYFSTYYPFTHSVNELNEDNGSSYHLARFCVSDAQLSQPASTRGRCPLATDPFGSGKRLMPDYGHSVYYPSILNLTTLGSPPRGAPISLPIYAVW
jgi:hypothetical protein